MGINVVLPMAGLGKRFVQAGYEKPKYLIEVKNRTLLEYSLTGLPLEICSKLILIMLKEHLVLYNIEALIKRLLPGLEIVIFPISAVTRGQAETVLKVKDYINNDDDLIVYNIDTYSVSKGLNEALLKRKRNYDGILTYFISNENKWSYASLDEFGYVKETAEKKVISENALTGLYHFSKGSDFVSAAEYYISNDITSNNEFYIAPMYNRLISQNKKYILMPAEIMIPLGTPEDLLKYEKN